MTISTNPAARLALSIFLATFALSSAASATALRTFVASTGSDSNTTTTCGLAAPCRTFNGAYGVTTAGGEIVALDAAGYGQLTITHALTIVGEHIAFATAPASGSAIAVTAGASDTVLLRNIEVNGAGAANSTGITVNSGHLILQHSVLTQLTTGLLVNSTKADLLDTDILANTTGISTAGPGIDQNAQQNGGTTEVRLSFGNVVGNGTAFFMQNPTIPPSETQNSITILLQLNSNTSVAITTNMAGNATLVSGNGTACTSQAGNCQSVGTYENTSSFNQK
jgi:hypothetical protein